MTLEERLYAASPAAVRTALLNLHAARIALHRYGAPYRRARAGFDALARGPVEAVRAYQLVRLGEVLGAAYRNSAFYRRMMDDRHLKPADITNLDAITNLPVLTREVLRENESDIVTSRRPRAGWLHGHTSGTTGSPLSLWYDRTTCIMTNAADGLQKLWGGVESGDYVGMFLGRTITPLSASNPPFWHANHVLKQVWFSSFHLSDDTLPMYLAEIRRRGLRFLEGYPSTLYIVAKHVVETGQRLPMKAVFSSSETMLDIQKETIEQAFDAPVFDFYGHAERAVFAIECERHEAKHIVEPFGLVEIVNGRGERLPDGEVGFIVGTSLHNTAMPLLRYQTTDLSAIEPAPCACGRSFRRLRRVSTKAEDIVVLPDGRWISPSILTHPFKPYPQIRKSQVIQERVDSIRVKLVASESFSHEHEEELLAALRGRLGAGITVVIERVDEIPPEKSGKFRWVISRVPHNLKVKW